MTFLHRYSIRRPVPVLIAAGLVVAAAAPGALRLRLRTDGYALVPTGRPEVDFDRSVRDEFNCEDVIVVQVRAPDPDGLFTAGTLALIQRLTLAFQALPGVEPFNVSSLDTEYSHRVKPGTLTFRRFLEPLPRTAEQLTTLREDLEKIELYTGTIVSRDGSAAAIFVGVPEGADRTDLYRQVKEIIAAEDVGGLEIHVVGAPVAEALLGLHILEDLGVPRALLGLPASLEDTGHGWARPTSLHDLRLLLGRYVGLVPLAILIMLLVFFAAFRSVAAAVIPLIEVGACLVTVFGLMGWCGVPIYLTVAVMPVILTSMGVADEIHIFHHYAELLRATPGQPQRTTLRTALDEMWVPVVKTSVTTAIGFLSFALSPLGPVQAFGLFTAVGIIFCMIWSLTVVPAMLALVDPRGFVRRKSAQHASPALAPRFFAAFTGVVLRHRWAVLLLALLIVALTPLGVYRIVVQDSWINGFAPASEFYQATRSFNDHFLGGHILLVRVEGRHSAFGGQIPAEALDHHSVRVPADSTADPAALLGQRVSVFRSRDESGTASSSEPTQRNRPGAWWARITEVTRDGDELVVTTERRSGSPVIALRPAPGEMIDFEIRVEPMCDPQIIRRIAELETFIAGRSDLTVGGVIGPAAFLTTTNFIARGLKEGSRELPDSADRIEWLWDQYQRIRGVERLQQIVDPDFARSLVTVYLKNANFVDVQALMDAIRAYEVQHLAPYGLTLGFAGDVAVSQTLIRAIVQTQVFSLGGSLLGVLLITALLGRSLRWGLLCVTPCTLALLINFAVMGWIDMPLGVATSMFASMTLGIGDDYAIHLLERYRWARRRGLDVSQAITDAMTVAGPANVVDALGVSLGFGVLVLSQVPANARLGALVVLSIVGCLAATLLLLPALLRVWPPRGDVTAAPPCPSPEPASPGPSSPAGIS